MQNYQFARPALCGDRAPGREDGNADEEATGSGGSGEAPPVVGAVEDGAGLGGQDLGEPEEELPLNLTNPVRTIQSGPWQIEVNNNVIMLRTQTYEVTLTYYGA